MQTGSVSTSSMYRHPVLGQDIPAGIPGYYTPEREIRLSYAGREVLCVIGTSVLEASCCGVGRWKYAAVPGFIVRWHVSTEEGRPVSEIEPVTDPQVREDLRKMIEDRDLAEAVQFM
jgi:hypothetical protein